MTPDPQTKRDMPNFGAWNFSTLVSFAQEAYTRMCEQEAAIEQLRLDLKDAVKLLRERNKTEEDDWK